MGGTAESFAEADLRDHLRGALQGTTRLSRADCKATIDANYSAVRVTQPNQAGQQDQIGEPHGLVVAPDGRVLYIGRGGGVNGAPVVTDWNSPDMGKGLGRIHVYDPGPCTRPARSTSTTTTTPMSPAPSGSPSGGQVFTPPRAGDPGTDGRRYATGYIGLQVHSTTDVISYRDIRIKEL